MFRKTFFIILILALLSLFCLSGCGLPPAESQLPAEESTAEIPVAAVEEESSEATEEEEIIHWNLHVDYPMGNSIRLMNKSADLVFLGRYISYERTENTLKEPKDEYSLNRIYLFQIDQVLKGEEERKEVEISIPYERMYNFDEYEAVLQDAFYIEPELEQSYILFLKKSSRDRYFPAVEPYMVLIDEEGVAHMQSNLLLPEEKRSELSRGVFRYADGKTVTVQTSRLEQEGFTDKVSGRHLDDILKEFGVEAK